MSRSILKHLAATASSQQVQAARQQAGAWWKARTQREQRLLQIGAALLGLTLLWLVGLKPPLESIERSREQLPRLRAEAAEIDALILEANALQRQQTGRTGAADLPQALQMSLRRAGLEDAARFAGDTSTPNPAASVWEVSVHDANAARLMEWLAGLPHLLHLQVTTVELSRSRIDGRDRPGQVSGRITLQQPHKVQP